jgi:N-acetyl-anhydromuramyl-L-alanine amidase AmpD
VNVPQDITFKASPAFDVGRGGKVVDRFIIHDTEGGFQASLDWLTRPNSQNSAHYIMDAAGSKIVQMVKLSDTAWHCGNYDWNQRSIGVEHEGYQAQGNFQDSMYRTSAKLLAYLCKQYNLVPEYKKTIFAHNDVPQNPDDKHTDPGPFWDWNKYISYIKQEMQMNPNPNNLNVGKGFLDYLQNVIHEQAATEERYIKNAPGGVSVLRTAQGSLLMATQDVAANGTYLASWTITKLA